MIKDLDELEELCSELEDLEAVMWESTEEYQIVLEGYRIHIPQLDIDIYPTLWFNYIEEEKDYTLDYELYLFFPTGSNVYVYSEGYSSLQSAIHNYLTLMKANLSLADLTFTVIQDVAVQPDTDIQ